MKKFFKKSFFNSLQAKLKFVWEKMRLRFIRKNFSKNLEKKYKNNNIYIYIQVLGILEFLNKKVVHNCCSHNFGVNFTQYTYLHQPIRKINS